MLWFLLAFANQTALHEEQDIHWAEERPATNALLRERGAQTPVDDDFGPEFERYLKPRFIDRVLEALARLWSPGL